MTGIYLPLKRIVRGYEMHMGQTFGPDCDRPLLELEQGSEGAISPDGRVMGCYLHGLFADDKFRSAFLADFHDRTGGMINYAINYAGEVQRALDRLADHLEQHLDLDALFEAAR